MSNVVEFTEAFNNGGFSGADNDEPVKDDEDADDNDCLLYTSDAADE